VSQHTIEALGLLSHSDHKTVLLTIRGPVQSDEPTITYVYKEANWEYFQHLINNNLNTESLTSNASTGDIDNAVTHLIDVLREAAQKATRIETRTFKSTQTSPSIRLLIQNETNYAHFGRKHII
jgi:hypothetical protein